MYVSYAYVAILEHRVLHPVFIQKDIKSLIESRKKLGFIEHLLCAGYCAGNLISSALV